MKTEGLLLKAAKSGIVEAYGYLGDTYWTILLWLQEFKIQHFIGIKKEWSIQTSVSICGYALCKTLWLWYKKRMEKEARKTITKN